MYSKEQTELDQADMEDVEEVEEEETGEDSKGTHTPLCCLTDAYHTLSVIGVLLDHPVTPVTCVKMLNTVGLCAGHHLSAVL